jgi:hypothetical protein
MKPSGAERKQMDRNSAWLNIGHDLPSVKESGENLHGRGWALPAHSEPLGAERSDQRRPFRESAGRRLRILAQRCVLRRRSSGRRCNPRHLQSPRQLAGRQHRTHLADEAGDGTRDALSSLKSLRFLAAAVLCDLPPWRCKTQAAGHDAKNGRAQREERPPGSATAQGSARAHKSGGHRSSVLLKCQG